MLGGLERAVCVYVCVHTHACVVGGYGWQQHTLMQCSAPMLVAGVARDGLMLQSDHPPAPRPSLPPPRQATNQRMAKLKPQGSAATRRPAADVIIK